MMKTLEGEGIAFDDICIDRSMPEDNAPTRKPRTGMLNEIISTILNTIWQIVFVDRRPCYGCGVG